MLTGSIMWTGCTSPKKQEISLIPAPVKMVQNPGYLLLKGRIDLVTDQQDQLATCQKYLEKYLVKIPGLHLKHVNSTKGKNIHLFINPDFKKEFGSEGYQLDITDKGIQIQGRKPDGIFRGIQTLLQLLPPEIYGNSISGKISFSVPLVHIEDRPRFTWRGYMLDVSRHFFDKEFILKVIDELTMHKMNTLHLHLVDDQGWRIEIKKYPKLTEVGAWRVDRGDAGWNSSEGQKPGEKATYGGFYTQDDIREIVKYAQDHYVTIIPEIEMPAHVSSAIASYPWLSCTGKQITVPPGSVWPITNIYCAGKERTFQFLEDVLTEVMELFPSKYIHIGGDEATKTEWKKCPDCQRRIRTEGLKDENELQSYFIRRIEHFLNDHGRQLIGWDEILEGGLAPNAAVMSWRGIQGGIKAATSGHPVVMSPTSNCYFDYYQGDPDIEPLAIGGYLPLQKVYAFEPVPADLDPQQAKFIIGAQANLWTEYVSTPSHAEYMTFPRLSALAEVVWSPKASRNYSDFIQRLPKHLKRLEAAGINYAKSFANVHVTTKRDTTSFTFNVKLTSDFPPAEIHYTLDGKNPDASSPIYQKPFSLTKTTTIKALAFFHGEAYSAISSKTVWVHLASGKPVTYFTHWSPRYSAGGVGALTNSLRGSLNHGDGFWQGFEGEDLEATVDLGHPVQVHQISLGCLQSVGSWIFFPEWVTFEGSKDGTVFSPLGRVERPVPINDPERRIEDYQAKFNSVSVRYIRVKAKNTGVCPDWHAGAGGKAWLFVDELIVE